MNNITIEDEGREIQDIQSEYIAGLKKENERLRKFAEAVVEWSEAYPTWAFPDPTLDQLKAAGGHTPEGLQRVASTILREFTKPWGQRASEALTGGKG